MKNTPKDYFSTDELHVLMDFAHVAICDAENFDNYLHENPYLEIDLKALQEKVSAYLAVTALGNEARISKKFNPVAWDLARKESFLDNFTESDTFEDLVEIVNTMTRDECITVLANADKNGTYKDDDSLSQDMTILTTLGARRHIVISVWEGASDKPCPIDHNNEDGSVTIEQIMKEWEANRRTKVEVPVK